MQAGILRDRITIKIPVASATKQDSFGAPIPKTFRDLECWANVMEARTSSDEWLNEERVDSEIRHDVKIRWEPGVGYDFLNGESYIEFQELHMNIVKWFINRDKGFVTIQTKALIK